LKDLLDGRGFLRVNPEAIPDGHGLPSRIGVAGGIVHRLGVVSVGPASGRISLEKLTIETTLGGFPEIVKVELIDEASTAARSIIFTLIYLRTLAGSSARSLSRRPRERRQAHCGTESRRA